MRIIIVFFNNLIISSLSILISYQFYIYLKLSKKYIVLFITDISFIHHLFNQKYLSPAKYYNYIIVFPNRLHEFLQTHDDFNIVFFNFFVWRDSKFLKVEVQKFQERAAINHQRRNLLEYWLLHYWFLQEEYSANVCIHTLSSSSFPPLRILLRTNSLSFSLLSSLSVFISLLFASFNFFLHFVSLPSVFQHSCFTLLFYLLSPRFM